MKNTVEAYTVPRCVWQMDYGFHVVDPKKTLNGLRVPPKNWLFEKTREWWRTPSSILGGWATYQYLNTRIYWYSTLWTEQVRNLRQLFWPFFCSLGNFKAMEFTTPNNFRTLLGWAFMLAPQADAAELQVEMSQETSKLQETSHVTKKTHTHTEATWNIIEQERCLEYRSMLSTK